MLDILGTIFSSVVGGGMTGILGVVVQRIADYKNKQLDLQLVTLKNNHEVHMREVDAEIMREEWTARTKIAEVEAEAKEDVAESQAFAASFNEPVRYSEPTKHSIGQSWVMVILDAIRGLVRPTLTIYLCALTTIIYLHSKKLLYLHGVNMTPDQAIKHVNLIIGTVLYLTTTCVLWWFGTRNKTPQPKIK